MVFTRHARILYLSFTYIDVCIPHTLFPVPQIRVLDVVRNALLAAMPGRWWQEVIEVPLAATAAFSAAKLLVIRLQVRGCS